MNKLVIYILRLILIFVLLFNAYSIYAGLMDYLFPAKMKSFMDISYILDSKNPENKLDIYAPKIGNKYPVMVFVHGGGFRMGDKRRDAAVKPWAFVNKGYVFVSINYRLYPSVKYPDYFKDTAAAIIWIYKNITRYGGDNKKIFIMGHSSGAHIAALISTDESYLNNEGFSLNILSGTVLLDYAYYNLPEVIKFGEGNKRYITSIFGTDPEVWEKASPVKHVKRGKNIPPFLIFFIESGYELRRQAEEFSRVLINYGIEAPVKVVRNKDHFSLNNELGTSGDIPTSEIFTFLQKIVLSK